MQIELIREYFNQTVDDKVVLILFTLIIVDLLTGILKAVVQRNLNSSIGINGLFKHVTVILLTIVGYPLILFAGLSMVYKDAIILCFVLQYAVSILENTQAMGIRYPRWLTNRIIHMRDDFEGDEMRELEQLHRKD